MIFFDLNLTFFLGWYKFITVAQMCNCGIWQLKSSKKQRTKQEADMAGLDYYYFSKDKSHDLIVEARKCRICREIRQIHKKHHHDSPGSVSRKLYATILFSYLW